MHWGRRCCTEVLHPPAHEGQRGSGPSSQACVGTFSSTYESSWCCHLWLHQWDSPVKETTLGFIHLIKNTIKQEYYEILLQLKIWGFKFLYILRYNVSSCDGNADFSAAITPVSSATWSFRIHSNMLIWCSRNIYYHYKCWKLYYFCGQLIWSTFDMMLIHCATLNMLGKYCEWAEQIWQ